MTLPGNPHRCSNARIMAIVGTPGPELLKKMQSEEARNYIRSLPNMIERLAKVVTPSAIASPPPRSRSGRGMLAPMSEVERRCSDGVWGWQGWRVLHSGVWFRPIADIRLHAGFCNRRWLGSHS